MDNFFDIRDDEFCFSLEVFSLYLHENNIEKFDFLLSFVLALCCCCMNLVLYNKIYHLFIKRQIFCQFITNAFCHRVQVFMVKHSHIYYLHFYYDIYFSNKKKKTEHEHQFIDFIKQKTI